MVCHSILGLSFDCSVSSRTSVLCPFPPSHVCLLCLLYSQEIPSISLLWCLFMNVFIIKYVFYSDLCSLYSSLFSSALIRLDCSAVHKISIRMKSPVNPVTIGPSDPVCLISSPTELRGNMLNNGDLCSLVTKYC